jgi:ribosomal protein S18 acetylase RimI-like enzyme
MEISTLEGIDIKEILKVFNLSFSNYFIPFKLTEEQLASKLLVDKTDLSLSVGVFENGKLIAFILHGFDTINNQKVIYNGGTPVIPEKRGLGLTKKMYGIILPILANKGINKLRLEVITENIQAIRSYSKSGFRAKRNLLCYKGEVQISNTDSNIKIKELQQYNWQLMESFWDIYPSWQNSKSVVEELRSKNNSLGAYIENKLVGYVIYNPTSKRIQQIAVSKEFRRKRIATALVFELKERYGNTLSIINVDKQSSAVNSFLIKIGLENNLEQIEMELKLNKNFSEK